jgi:capsule polysaccharide export protein KpsE/RkpR
VGARIPRLQADILGKETELAAARQFATDENMSVRQILAELQSLRGQLQQAESLNASVPNSVGRVIRESTQVQKLERELAISRTLYDAYMRYLEGTSVEDLTSTANVKVLEPPFVDSARQLNTVPLAIGLLLLLIGLSVEFYQLRPPVGDRRVSA